MGAGRRYAYVGKQWAVDWEPRPSRWAARGGTTHWSSNRTGRVRCSFAATCITHCEPLPYLIYAVMPPITITDIPSYQCERLEHPSIVIYIYLQMGITFY